MALHLFDAVGVELEYMIVDSQSLNVAPITDRLFERVTGGIVSDVENGDIDWSNELVQHVVELKTAKPAPLFDGLAGQFQSHVQRINGELVGLNARLMPSAMHPWMNPDTELRLWPYDNSEIYSTFHRIFDCRGHGWANLQSMHLNFPFCGDDAPDSEFGRLHAAIRLILPILPAIAASSPLMDGRLTGLLDSRLEVYRTNARRLKSIVGSVIPEPAYTRADYDAAIFQPMFREIAPLDPDGVLCDEFLNARGAIARFSRGAIEIRVIDIQECPAADLAVARATTAALQALVGERWTTLAEQQRFPVERLYELLLPCIRDADAAVISDAEYLRLLGWHGAGPVRAIELWRHLIEQTADFRTDDVRGDPATQTILNRGPLARRLIEALGPDPTFEQLQSVYGELCDSLAQGRMFRA